MEALVRTCLTSPMLGKMFQAGPILARENVQKDIIDVLEYVSRETSRFR